MDQNFVGLLRALPFWPNDLVPLDEVFTRVVSLLGFDEATIQSIDPLTFIGGLVGVRDVQLRRYDGVTTVTGDIAVGTELAFAPFQSYVGAVIGNTAPGITTIPFELRITDEPPTKNSDLVFQIDDNVLDPQLAAFQAVENNSDAGFRGVDSWQLRLRDVQAKLRILRGVTRVEELVPDEPTRGFRVVPDEFVDAGIALSLDFDADGTLELWPPDPLFSGAEGDALSALDLELGAFQVSDSPVVITADGVSYHKAGSPFDVEIEKPAGLPDDWEGIVARQLGGFWARVPTKPADEEHVYGLVVEHLFIGSGVFSARASFLHGGGPNDPFSSATPVAEADLPDSRWSLRSAELSVTTGVEDVLQIGGRVAVAAIIDMFDFQPVLFELSLGRVLRELEDIDDPMLFIEVQGSLAPVQSVAQPTPDGRLRLPLVDSDISSLKVEINGVSFSLQFPGTEVPLLDLPTTLRMQADLSIEIGEGPALIAGASGVGFEYVDGPGGRFKGLLEGLWIETKKVSPLDILGYKFSISRISFGFDSGDLHAYWLGFDAHLEFPDSLGRADVYGMRFGWDKQGALFSIEGIGIAVKTAVLEFEGIVRFLDGSSNFTPEGEVPVTIQPGSVAGFVRLAFPAASIPLAFEVGLMHGKYVVDAVPENELSFWMLSAELILPAGLPLGLGDLSLYGGAVAFGNNVAPRKAAATPWFDWYSKEAPIYDITAPTKWTAAHGRSAYGLGLIVGSALKSGYPHNERVLGLLNTASESAGSVWLFAGEARFLKEVTASGEPNIAILIVIEPDQILIRGEFNFSFPDDGLVVTTRGMVEVFIDQSGAGRHHLYLGRNLPASDRINASVLLGFFSSRSFYMIDWADLALSSRTLPAVAQAFGFAQTWEIDKRFGPLRFYLEANIEFEAGFSFAPAVYGFLRVYGGAGLRLWGYGFGLTVDASFTLFVADDWEMFGSLRVKLNLPWPVPDYRKTLDFHWGVEPNAPTPMQSPLRQMALSSIASDQDNPFRDWSETNDPSVPDAFDDTLGDLAVDGSLVFAMRTATSNNVPWITGVDVQPVDGSGDWKFRYLLEDMILRRKLAGGTDEAVPAAYETGFWEIATTTPASPAAETSGDAPATEAIRIWGDLPGQQLRNLGGLERAGSVTWIDGFLDRFGTWPCGPDVDLDPICVHFDLVSFRVLDTTYSRITMLPDGTPIRSRTLFNPDDVLSNSNLFVTLDVVAPNPRPDLWNDHAQCLRLPYVYLRPSDFNKDHGKNYRYGPLPLVSALEVRVPDSVEVTVTVIGVFPSETFTLEALDGSTSLGEVVASGSGLHVLTVQAPAETAIDSVRLMSVNDDSTSDAPDPGAVSVLASVCFTTVDQRDLDDHIVGQRDQLDAMTEIILSPPGLPGENGEHFRLHPNGTEYTITPVCSAERKGPDSGWETVHDHLHLAPVTVRAGLPPADLRPYMDQTLPVESQDPVYLDDDVQLRFNHAYGPEMYTISGFDFRVEVLDTQRNPIPVTLEWAFSEEPALSPSQELLVETLAASPCIDADLSAVRKKLEVVLRPTLAPRALHYLVINSTAHDAPLFDVPFSTSRYYSFSEQYLEVGSRVRHELLPRPVDPAIFQSLLASFVVADREEENTALETAWEDGLGLKFRERPQRGEVVVLYQPGADGPGEPIGLLLDSPEPLLVPVRTTVVVTTPGVTVSTLRNIDGARTLIFAHAAGEIVSLAPGTYSVSTTYRRTVDGLPVQRVAGDASATTETLTVEVVSEPEIALEAL